MEVTPKKLIATLKAEGESAFGTTVAIGQWMQQAEADQAQTLAMLREHGFYKSKPWLSKRTTVYGKLIEEWQMAKEDLTGYDFEFWYETARHLNAVKKQKDPRDLLSLVAKNGWTVKEYEAYLAGKEAPKKNSKDQVQEDEYEKVSMSKATISRIDAFQEMVESVTEVRVGGRDKLVELALEYAYHQLKEGQWVPDVEGLAQPEAEEE